MTKGKQQECAPVLDKIHKYITYGTFYGFNFDLTRSQQAQSAGQETTSELPNVDTRFMWNYGMCKELIAQGIKKHWCIPLI